MSTSEPKKAGASVSTTSTSTSTSPSPSPSASDSHSVTANNSTYRLPSDTSLQHASKLSIVEDKPIMLDYWTASVDKKALVGVRESGEKLLVKSAEEYTSPIAKFYKSGTEYIIITENSIYLVSSDIPTRKIS
jgi:hypothetical protein